MIIKIVSLQIITLFFSVSVFILSCYTSSYGETEVYLGLKKTGYEKISIAVTELKAKVETHKIQYISRNSTNILVNDLQLTGLFAPVKNKTFINEVEQIDKKEGKTVFAEWSRIGAQALIKGSYLFSGGKLVIDFKLYDTHEAKLLLSKRYSAKVRKLRKVIHKFCDDIVYLITGEQGIAQTKIAFSSYYAKNKEIYLMDYDGYNLTRLTREKSIAISPSWSPDGKYIAFTSYRNGNPDIYSIKIPGGIKKALSTRKGLNATPSWSPDGKHIAVTLSKDKNSEIYIMKKDGSNLKRLTRNRGIDTSPSWSPDGKKIAFTSDRAGSPQIYIMNSDGTGVKRITYSAKECQSPDWSPKGDKITYSCRQNRYFDIYIIGISKNKENQLTRNRKDDENPSWSPDGRHIVFESSSKGVHNLYMMHADGSDQHMILKKIKGGGYNPSWSPRFN